MFGWLWKSKKEVHVFESGRQAFEYAWASMNYGILLEAVIPALVEEKGERGPEGEHYFRLRLAIKEGITELWGCTLKEATDYPEVGDFVGFRIVRVATELPPEMSIIGYISCKLEPVLVGISWKIAKNYTPANIKQTVRF